MTKRKIVTPVKAKPAAKAPAKPARAVSLPELRQMLVELERALAASLKLRTSLQAKIARLEAGTMH